MTQRSKFPSSFFLAVMITKLLYLCNSVISQSGDVTTPNTDHHHMLTHVLSSLRQHLLNGTSEMLTDAFHNGSNDFDLSSFAFTRNGDCLQVGLRGN